MTKSSNRILKFFLNYIQNRIDIATEERRSFESPYNEEEEKLVYRLDGAIFALVQVEEFIRVVLEHSNSPFEEPLPKKGNPLQ